VVRLVLFGRQGAGKGTQSVRLAAHYGAPHISTGDMLREAVAAGTDFGRKAKEYMDAGQLLPDDVILGIVEERLAAADVRAGGFLLDWFPRTVGQAEALLALTDVDVAIDIDVPEAVVLERISSRRVCESCGRIYSLAEPPSVDWTCDTCGGHVVQRDDDTTEAVRKRLDAYAASTVPTIEWFAEQGRLLTVDGVGSPDEVAARIIAGVDERIQG
jgi:adenylate kinase